MNENDKRPKLKLITNTDKPVAKRRRQPLSSPEQVEDVEAAVKRLFVSLLAFYKVRAGGKVSEEDLRRMAKAALDEMPKPTHPIGWKTAEPSLIEAGKRARNVNRGLRIYATIAELHDPMILADNNDDAEPNTDVEFTRMKLVDSSGASVWSLAIVGSELVSKLQTMRRNGKPVEVLCSPVAVPVGVLKAGGLPASEAKEILLRVIDVRDSVSALDLLGASSEERAIAQRLLDELHKHKVSPADFLFKQVVDGLGIVGLDKLPLLGDIVRFTTLQAVSVGGTVNHAPSTLSCAVVGPSGHGKKLLGLSAITRQPVSSEISATKTSVGGLIGSSRRTEHGWVSDPGALPRASGGVAWIQDANGWSDSMVAKLAPAIQELLEDGVLRDTVSGGQRRELNTALFIDLNRTTHVMTGGGPAKEAALLRIARPILSRLDLIVEIPQDARRIWELSEQMYESLSHGRKSLVAQPWVRLAKLLVALLRDRNPTVDLKPVRKLMARVHREIRKANEKALDRPEAGDIPARLTISFARYVAASARARDASVANAEDVKVGAHFLKLKLNFLLMNGLPKSTTVWADAGAESFEDWLDRHAGEEVELKLVMEVYRATAKTNVSQRTVQRRLDDLGGSKGGYGRYRLPPRLKR